MSCLTSTGVCVLANNLYFKDDVSIHKNVEMLNKAFLKNGNQWFSEYYWQTSFDIGYFDFELYVPTNKRMEMFVNPL
jgi:hypothetical protein